MEIWQRRGQRKRQDADRGEGQVGPSVVSVRFGSRSVQVLVSWSFCHDHLR
jgi:hypothetical protein